MSIEDLIKELQEFQQMNPNAKCFVRNLEGIYNENVFSTRFRKHFYNICEKLRKDFYEVLQIDYE
jgi:hypothetical protein